MDWKYIFSLAPDELKDDDKDYLYNTVAWFECDREEISVKQCKALLKISQELMKYKSEQVETLLHELDEIATRQGEEEVRKFESDVDVRSTKSRKSSIEVENLEQKYIELKTKHKKQLKINERNLDDINKFKRVITSLEGEKNQLEHELRTSRHDDSQSDTSETVKEQHRELVETVHNKNKQLSHLLHDIEEIEEDNVVLRKKLSTLRDELSNATSELKSLTQKLESSTVQLSEAEESVIKCNVKNDILQEELLDMTNQKEHIESQFAEFTSDINVRIEEWQKILKDRDSMIRDLKAKTFALDKVSSESTISFENEPSHISALNKLLKERENQLFDLQTQLHDATKEMEESTEIIKNLKKEKEDEQKKVVELTYFRKELKKQLKATHERGQNLQEQLTIAEQVAQSKDSDLKQFIQQLNKDGHIDLAKHLVDIQEIKAANRNNERHVMELVKTTNKLQDNCDQLEKENSMLRDQLGLSGEEYINTSGYQSKKKVQRKEVQKLKKQVLEFEEDNLQLKSEIQKLKRMYSISLDQIRDIGENPKKDRVEITVVQEIPEAKEEVQESLSKEEIKVLVEENEALRKGMHEILNNLNMKKESSLKEIKSETFEQFLRALDVKHISGWYHPAMRLQAEVHNVEGVNAELREQLRLCRLQISELQNEKSENDRINGENKLLLSSQRLQDSITLTDVGTLEDLNRNVEHLLERTTVDADNYQELANKLETYNEEFEDTQTQLKFVYKEYVEDKRSLETGLNDLHVENRNLKDTIETLQLKINVLTQNKDLSDQTKKLADLMAENFIINRKYHYVNAEVTSIFQLNTKLKTDFLNSQKTYSSKINELSRNNKSLRGKIKILDNIIESTVKYEEHHRTKKDLDNLTIKFRELMQDYKKQMESTGTEINLVKKSKQMLEQEKIELKNKLNDCLSKLNCTQINGNFDVNIELLARKLSESEVNEIGERQRANHVNNLYELVKEQLQKSEERFKEYENYSKDIMHKNLILQEQLKAIETKCSDFIDINSYNSLKAELNNYMELNDKLQSELLKMKEEQNISAVTTKTVNMWSVLKEQELLHLKHQIVDLQSTSDDKSVIAQIGSDLIQARAAEADWRNRYDAITLQLESCHEEWLESLKALDDEKEKFDLREAHLRKKNGIIQELLDNQKLQYMGCIPLTSEDRFVNTIKHVFDNKHVSFLALWNAQNLENENFILKEQQEVELRHLLEAQKIYKGDKEEVKKILNWQQEKKYIELDLIRYRRQAQFEEMQLKQNTERLLQQNEQIAKLEEELFLAHRDLDGSLQDSYVDETDRKLQNITSESIDTTMKFNKSQEIQTDYVPSREDGEIDRNYENLKSELLNTKYELELKEEVIQQMKIKLNDCEMNLSLFRKQIGDKQSQIMFYEKHILEMQNKKEDIQKTQEDSGISSITPESNEELLASKANIKALQDTVLQKEETILHYQSLLKEDRDNHSLAAARMQEELKMLKASLAEEKQQQTEKADANAEFLRSKVAIEQYVKQVHALEKHTDELHTTVSTLDSQLQASRKESVRWRSLANDRLQTMDDLRKSLEEQHQNELEVYKRDSEKWREEVLCLKEMINKHKNELLNVQPELQHILKIKDDKIHELTVMLRQAKNVRKSEKHEYESSPKHSDLESYKEQLMKEQDTLRKRCEQLLQRDRSARDEIRDLKAQLMRSINRPAASARTDKNEKSMKDQLQRKVTLLEEEVVHLREALNNQISINESHKIKISEDFERWNKQKQAQQTVDRLKSKLKEKDTELEKSQNTCAGYKVLIERLEREKHSLESRIKILKSSNMFTSSNQTSVLTAENAKLSTEIEQLKTKLETQQHHAGGLGAVMLQEKLEGQERKIAILELAAKGTLEVRAELERMQNLISSLQKSNLCSEALNIELKMDLEKAQKDVPHFREQIQHLENYIEVLKVEHSKNQTSHSSSATNPDNKKVAELERTVFVLKRVVEKLQVENKRLRSGKRSPIEHPISADKLRRDYHRLKEQYGESVHKVSQLERELSATNNKLKAYESRAEIDNLIILSDELGNVKQQLEQKTQLLDKVKVLLHRAATKEKELLREIARLKLQADVDVSAAN